jgi:hypothetical protein
MAALLLLSPVTDGAVAMDDQTFSLIKRVGVHQPTAFRADNTARNVSVYAKKPGSGHAVKPWTNKEISRPY